jgi:hypothetical protein
MLPLVSNAQKIANEHGLQQVTEYERACLQNLRTLSAAQVTHYLGGDLVEKGYTETGYAATLEALGPKGKGLIDPILASGEKAGYRYVLTPAGVENGLVLHYTISATPVKRLTSNQKSYFTNDVGFIRFTDEDRPATVSDPISAPPLSSETREKSPEPKLPVIDFDACGSGASEPYKLEADDDLYSTWQEGRTLIRRIAVGTEVTRIGAVNIIQKPYRGVITVEVDESLLPLAQGDEVFGYGLHPDGQLSYWGKGVSFRYNHESTAYKGSCGFFDAALCGINMIESGVHEWWIQLKTDDGFTGWILGIKENGDKALWGPNAGYACRD